MALKNTAPIGRTVKASFNWVTQAGANTLRNLPFGAALGVVASGAILWLAPHVVPEGWSAEAVISLGMGAGIVLHRLLDWGLGWFVEPVRRHLGSRWEAWLQLDKLDGYQKRGLLPPDQAQVLTARIVKDDIDAKGRGRR